MNDRELVEDAHFQRDFEENQDGVWWWVGKGRTCLPTGWFDLAERVEKYHVRKEDVWVSSYPKAGTTWTQEIVYLIVTNCDMEGAKENIETRFPYFESQMFLCESQPGWTDKLQFLYEKPSPRFVKTHLPLSLLPPSLTANKTKLVYVTRNPKDLVVSFYNFNIIDTSMKYRGSFKEFLRYLMEDKVLYAPLWTHVLEYWKNRHEENILFIHYEELQEDLPGMVVKIADFLGKTLSPAQISQIAHHCQFSQMKANAAVNRKDWEETGFLVPNKSITFMRKGKVGDWKNYFDEELDAIFTKWCDEQLQGSGLDYKYVVAVD